MTTNELRHKVINEVKELDDETLLHDLIRLIEDSSYDYDIYHLSDNHKKAINMAIDQIGKGDYLTNEQSNKQIDEWLNK